MTEQHCGHCGLPVDGVVDHLACEQRLRLEPPRFCVPCGRRMKVQVVPGGWSASCVEHGELKASTWD